METITYDQLKVMTIANLSKKVPFCFTTKVGLEVRVTKMASTYFMDTKGTKWSIKQIKEEIIVPVKGLAVRQTQAPAPVKVAAPAPITKTTPAPADTNLYSQMTITHIENLKAMKVKDLATKEKTIATLRQSATKMATEIAEMDAEIERRKKAVKVTRVTPFEVKALAEADYKHLYLTDALINYQADPAEKVELIGVNPAGDRILYTKATGAILRTTELFLIK